MAPLQLHMRSAGEVPHGQVSSHACSLYPAVFWPLWLDEELGNQNTWWHYLKDASCALKWEGSLPVASNHYTCLSSNPFIKHCISGDAKVSWHFSQVPEDWLRNDGQGGASGMLKCHVLLLQAPSCKLRNFHSQNQQILLSLLLLEGCFKVLLSNG